MNKRKYGLLVIIATIAVIAAGGVLSTWFSLSASALIQDNLQLLQYLEHLILTLIALAVLAISLWKGGASPQKAFMITGSLAASVLLFFANLPFISEFSAGTSGIAAKTRELNTVLNEAEVKLEELQQLARVVGSTTLLLAQTSGRFGGMKGKDTEKIKQDIINTFDAVGISQQEQEAVLDKVWHPWVEFDYVIAIGGAANTKRHRLQISGCQIPLDNLSSDKLPQPEELREILKPCELLTP